MFFIKSTASSNLSTNNEKNINTIQKNLNQLQNYNTASIPAMVFLTLIIISLLIFLGVSFVLIYQIVASQTVSKITFIVFCVASALLTVSFALYVASKPQNAKKQKKILISLEEELHNLQKSIDNYTYLDENTQSIINEINNFKNNLTNIRELVYEISQSFSKFDASINYINPPSLVSENITQMQSLFNSLLDNICPIILESIRSVNGKGNGINFNTYLTEINKNIQNINLLISSSKNLDPTINNIEDVFNTIGSCGVYLEKIGYSSRSDLSDLLNTIDNLFSILRSSDNQYLLNVVNNYKQNICGNISNLEDLLNILQGLFAFIGPTTSLNNINFLDNTQVFASLNDFDVYMMNKLAQKSNLEINIQNITIDLSGFINLTGQSQASIKSQLLIFLNQMFSTLTNVNYYNLHNQSGFNDRYNYLKSLINQIGKIYDINRIINNTWGKIINSPSYTGYIPNPITDANIIAANILTMNGINNLGINLLGTSSFTGATNATLSIFNKIKSLNSFPNLFGNDINFSTLDETNVHSFYLAIQNKYNNLLNNLIILDSSSVFNNILSKIKSLKIATDNLPKNSIFTSQNAVSISNNGNLIIALQTQAVNFISSLFIQLNFLKIQCKDFAGNSLWDLNGFLTGNPANYASKFNDVNFLNSAIVPLQIVSSSDSVLTQTMLDYSNNSINNLSVLVRNFPESVSQIIPTYTVETALNTISSTMNNLSSSLSSYINFFSNNIVLNDIFLNKYNQILSVFLRFSTTIPSLKMFTYLLLFSKRNATDYIGIAANNNLNILDIATLLSNLPSTLTNPNSSIIPI